MDACACPSRFIAISGPSTLAKASEAHRHAGFQALQALPPRAFLVAVSGGRDSVALLHALHAAGRRKLTVVHLDHRLRGRVSTGDARFVARLAEQLGYPALIGRADARAYARDRGMSVELAARELRHVFFEACARRTRCRRVLLAHHADDQIETCLHRFLRGSGPAGLAGMRRETVLGRLTLIRPLLGVRRAEIDAYVAVHRLRFREDATNAEPTATRNRLRHEVLPLVERVIGPPDAILRAAEIFAAEEEWMAAEVAKFPLTGELAVPALRSQPLALQRRVIRRWLESADVPVGFAEVERVRALLDGNGPAKVNLPEDRHARRRRGAIFLEP